VLDLEKDKDAQAVEILKLKKRVKKLERPRKSSILHPKRRIYRQVESSDDDLDEEDASKQERGQVTRQSQCLKTVILMILKIWWMKEWLLFKIKMQRIKM
ncbi:hypothetical protein Tco_0358716, partial [Tanacetum coccineum]